MNPQRTRRAGTAAGTETDPAACPARSRARAERERKSGAPPGARRGAAPGTRPGAGARRAAFRSPVPAPPALTLTLILTLILTLLLPSAPARAAYESEMAAFAAQDAAHPPPADVIVFVGSSTFTRWTNLADSFPDWPVLNRGFGGSKMSDVLEHYDKVVKPYKAPLILLYEGDNDIAEGLAPAVILQQYQTFVDRVAADSPATQIAIVSVKPSPSRASSLAAMQDLNTRLRNLCATTPRLRYVDTATPMLNASGQPRPELFGSDMLHMNAAGYTLWTEVITPVLDAVFPGVPDDVPPVIASAVPVGTGGMEIRFSKKLSAATVTAAGAWTLEGAEAEAGNTVTAAALLTDARTVRLTLARPAAGRVTVRVSGVADTFGNPVAADTRVTVDFPDQLHESLLFDFGSAATVTTAADDPVRTWNNVTAETGASVTGRLTDLKTISGAVTGMSLAMIRRFNSANTNGTASSGLFPADATSDSLFGNTEVFSSLSNLFPAFKLTGLPGGGAWDLTFYASRTGVTDNRETLYTVTGAGPAVTATLNAAGNQSATASVFSVRPDAAGEITIALSPGPKNNNAHHFTYLGVLRLDPSPPLVLLPPVLADGVITLDWTGRGTLEAASALEGPWLPLPAADKRPFYQEAAVPGRARFFRLRAAGL